MSLDYARISKDDPHALGKSEARFRLINMIDEANFPKRNLSLLTLPGAWWHLEKEYLPMLRGEGYNIQVTGCESHKLLFKTASFRMPRTNRGFKATVMSELKNAWVVTNRRNCVLVNCDIADYIAVTNHQFDIVWLDFCGPITNGMMDTISLVKRVLNPQSLLAITILRARESAQYSKEIKSFKDGRIGFLKEQIKVLVDSKMEMIDAYEYCDSSPMLQATFRR